VFSVGAGVSPGIATDTPMWPPGHWKTAVIAATVMAFAAYAAGLLLLARAQVSGRAVLAIAAAIQTVALTGPLLLATDVRTNYVPYGRSSTPYRGVGSPYGPLWTFVSVPVSRIGDGVFAFRVLAAVSSLALVALAWRLATRKALAAAFVGWNPLLALHEAGGGHNDAFMMVFVLGALALARSGSRTLSGAAWAASVAVKWSSAPVYLLWAIAERRRHRSAGLTGALLTGTVLVAIAFLAYGSGWLNVFATLSHFSNLSAQLGLSSWLVGSGVSPHLAIELTHVGEVTAVALFALAAWRGRLRLGLAATVFALIASPLQPWYLVWGVALAAADEEDRFGRVLAVAATGYVLSDSITDFFHLP
jgi:hypothetical protein